MLLLVSEKSSDRNLASLLVRAARKWPRLPALAIGTRTLHTYELLAGRSARLASALIARGLRAGDRVAIVSRNAPAYVEAFFGIWWAGLVAVPVNSKLHPRELEFVLSDSGARFAFTDDDWHVALSSIAAALPDAMQAIALGSRDYESLIEGADVSPIAEVDRDAPAWLFYTSGTTGRPKGVVISHGNLYAMSGCFLTDVETIAPSDAILHAAPLSHGSGLYVLPHVMRGAVNVVPESGGFDATETLALFGRWNHALMFAAPTMVKRLVATPAISGARLDRLKCIVYGGGPMYVEDCKAAFFALRPRLAQIYGQGETPMTITAMDRATLADAIHRKDDSRIASVGIAQTGIDVRIADDKDRPLPHGEVGEILVRGPTVMQGYWRNPDSTAKTLAGGWLHTGDLGVLDEDGFLTLKDRSKDLIISGGANIYPREVEEALLRHPDVVEVAVIGRRHDEWGEEVVACVVARVAIATQEARNAFERALDAHCLDCIARFKRPRAYVFLNELPKNNTGKVLKTALRDLIGESPI
jgi:acyl-CoA synthetase (AMP-forming)/AMP-acid ligase II